MSKKVTFKIDKEGNGKVIDLQGFGDQCLQAFAATQAKLGVAIGGAEYTAEYTKPPETDLQVQG